MRHTYSSGRASLTRSRTMRGSAVRSSSSSRTAPSGATGLRPAAPVASTATATVLARRTRRRACRRSARSPAAPAAGRGRRRQLLRLVILDERSLVAGLHLDRDDGDHDQRPTPATTPITFLPRDDTPSSSSASALENASSRPSSTLMVLLGDRLRQLARDGTRQGFRLRRDRRRFVERPRAAGRRRRRLAHVRLGGILAHVHARHVRAATAGSAADFCTRISPEALRGWPGSVDDQP